MLPPRYRWRRSVRAWVRAHSFESERRDGIFAKIGAAAPPGSSEWSGSDLENIWNVRILQGGEKGTTSATMTTSFLHA